MIELSFTCPHHRVSALTTFIAKEEFGNHYSTVDDAVALLSRFDIGARMTNVLQNGPNQVQHSQPADRGSSSSFTSRHPTIQLLGRWNSTAYTGHLYLAPTSYTTCTSPVCPKGRKRDITVNVECGGQYHLWLRRSLSGPQWMKNIGMMCRSTNC